MHNAWHLNDTAGMCALTYLHVHCFDFLAGPPQALELNPVVIVTEAAVSLTVRHSLQYVVRYSMRILCHLMPPHATSWSSDRSMLFNSTQGHEVFAKHNKFGIFLVPQSFLNWNGPPDQHHTLDTSALDLKKLSDVKVENTEAADKAAEEAAREKMKRVAKDEAKKARRKRAKTQQAAAAMAAMEEEAEVKAAAAVEEEKEAMAAAEIAMEHADPTKASKVESAVQIRPGSASDSALGWLRGRSSSLGGWPQ